jgi:hypothetical protein
MSDDIHPEDTAEFSRTEKARLKALNMTSEAIAAELTVIRGKLTSIETRICLKHPAAWEEAENISRAISRIDRLSDAITGRRA